MKYVLLAIFVLFAAQPLRAAGCDMCGDQDTQYSQHGNMHNGEMQDMDCCDDDSSVADKGCDSMSHCGACTAGLAAVNPTAPNAIFSSNSQPYLSVKEASLCRTKSPPFRPPIG